MNKSLYVKLAVFFLLISTIGSIVYLIVTNSMEKSKNISVMINKIAYERMLTEKITKKAIQYIILNDFRAKNRMEALMREFEDRFNKVKDEIGNTKFLTASEEIEKNLNHVEQQWNLLKMDINQFLSETEDPSSAVRQLEKKSDSLIVYLNKTIFLLEQEDQKSLRGLTLENILSLSFNIILILIIFVIWRLLVNLSINEKKYRILLHKSPLGIMIIKDRKFKFLNQYALQSLGFKNEKEIIGKSVLSFIHPNYHDLVLSRFHTVLEQKQPVEIIEEEWINANGETITVEVLSIPFHFMGDDTNLTIFRDITEKKRSSHYFQELINIKGALEKSSIVEIIDDNGIIKYVNDKFCKISKYEPSEVIGKSYEIMKSGFHSEQFYNELWDTLKQGKVWEGEIQNRAKDGTYYWVQTMVLPFINNNGHPYQFLIIKNDITDKKEAQKEIQELATKDHLTQLLNRRAFEEKLQELMNDKVNSAVFFLDLDRFKYINDSLGHSTGDILLKLVANRLRTLTDLAPFDSVIARFGGDEFAMLVPCNNKKLITNFAKNIMKEISLPYNIDGKELFITCSIGISFYPDHGNDLGTLMKNADIAMYWAKHNGKNDYSIYQNYMTKIPTEIMELELELRKAVEKKEFELYYQPKIDLFTKEIVGCEALIRWNHPWKGIVPPSKFIPLAEETGLIDSIGEWALREACQHSKILQNAGFPELQMAVNISVHQFRQENFVEMIQKVLLETQLEPRLLELEITESFSMVSKKEKIKKLYELKKLGVSIAIDDFGSGYSSLKYLTKLPVDTLKIDKSFIDEIGKSNDTATVLMVNAIISIAESLNLEVVAEGIETEEQMHYLAAHHCAVGQGYYISKPLPFDEFVQFLTDYRKNSLKNVKDAG